MARELAGTNEVIGIEYPWAGVGRSCRKWFGRGRDLGGTVCDAPRTSFAEDRLADVAAGTTVRVDRIHGDESFRGKMMAMGIVAGASLSVVQGGRGRPLLIALADCRLLLDRSSSELVSVRTDDHKGAE